MGDARKDSDIQHVVEDATGFNLRSLKTLRDLLARPNAVFRAYADGDRVTYTPALRLWLGLVGIQVIVSTLWGGWAGLLRRQIEGGAPETRAAYEQVSGGRLDAFIDHYADAANLLEPILVALFTSLSVFLLGAFNRALSWSSRFNIALGILAVGSLVGVLLMPPMLFAPINASLSAVAAVGGVTIAYFMTFLRGAPGVLATTALGGVVKALAYTIVLALLIFISGVVLSVVGALYAAIRVNMA